MAKTTAQTNKALVLEAFNTLFNKRDYKSAERYWSANYLQHSAHIKPGRDGLFDLIRSSPATLRYEPGTIVAEGDYVMFGGFDVVSGTFIIKRQRSAAITACCGPVGRH